MTCGEAWDLLVRDMEEPSVDESNACLSTGRVKAALQ